MADFPRKAGASANEVWTYATRNLNSDANNAIRDGVLSDGNKIAGANVDTTVSSRAAPGAEMNLADGAVAVAKIADGAITVAKAPNLDAAVSSRSTLAQADILSDATPFAGDRIAKSLVDGVPGEGTLNTDGLEQVVIEKDLSAAPKVARLEGHIDFTNHTGTETVVVRQYIQIKAAGVYVQYAEETYTGLVTPPLLKVDTNWARYKIKVTMQKTAGTNRAYDWQFFTKQQA